MTRMIDFQKDYETIVSWWKGYDWPVIPEEMLPSTGFIVEGKIAGFLYVTNSPMALFEWIIGNPDISTELRQDGLKDLVEFVVDWARDNNIKVLYHMAESSNLIGGMVSQGFEITDSGMTHMLRRV